MSFIEELMKAKGTEELGITYEEPKAHDEIDNIILNNELSPEIQEVIQMAIVGSIGNKGKIAENALVSGKNILNAIKAKNTASLSNIKGWKESAKLLENWKDIQVKGDKFGKVKPILNNLPTSLSSSIRENLPSFIEELIPALMLTTSMIGGKNIGEKYGNKISSLFIPDPEMKTKEEHDDDMDTLMLKNLPNPSWK